MTTSSPTETPETRGPTAETTPAPSEPRTAGSAILRPLRIHHSRRLSAAATRSTFTSPGPGSGSGSSVRTKPSGPPNARSSTARNDRLLDSTMPRDPVGVPGRALVERERLLPGGRVVGDVLPREADLHGNLVDDVVALEEADAVLEAADHRWVEPAVTDCRGPPDPPKAGLGLEQPQRESFEPRSTREVGCVVRVDVAEAAEDRARLAVRLELDPFAVGLEEVDPLAVCLLPASEEEVEVVAALLGPLCRFGWLCHGL